MVKLFLKKLHDKEKILLLKLCIEETNEKWYSKVQIDQKDIFHISFTWNKFRHFSYASYMDIFSR